MYNVGIYRVFNFKPTRTMTYMHHASVMQAVLLVKVSWFSRRCHLEFSLLQIYTHLCQIQIVITSNLIFVSLYADKWIWNPDTPTIAVQDNLEFLVLRHSKQILLLVLLEPFDQTFWSGKSLWKLGLSSYQQILTLNRILWQWLFHWLEFKSATQSPLTSLLPSIILKYHSNGSGTH